MFSLNCKKHPIYCSELVPRKWQPIHLSLGALLSLFILSGCEGGDDPSAGIRHAVSVDVGVLRLSTSTGKDTYDPFENINIILTAQNVSSVPVDLIFSRGTPPRFSNGNARVLDRNSLNHFIRGEGEDDSATLQPGESLNYQFNWNQVSRLRPIGQVDAGFYRVRGELLLESGVVEFPDLTIEIQ